MEAQSIPLSKLGIPPEFARYVDPAAPAPLKLLAAKGLVPAPPRALLAIQYCLLGDADPLVEQAAREGLLSMPTKLLENNLDDRTHSKILEFFAFYRTEDEALMETLVLKRQLNDRSICHLAAVVGPKLLEIIANNQERLLMTPELFDQLKRNPHVTRATIDRIEAFLRMFNVAEPDEHAEIPAALVEAGQAAVAAAVAAAAGPVTSGVDGFKHGFEAEEDSFAPDLIDEKEGVDPHKLIEEEKATDLWSTVGKLPIPKKIKLAYFGNSTARAILVRDRNKVVATSVVKSPRITILEVIAIAKNRNVCDDVIREISRNKEWFKNYQVKLSLVSNSKCPTPVAISIVNHLQLNDLKILARNRNVSSVVANAARQLLSKKGN